MNIIELAKELAGHRDVSPWVIKLVQDAVLAEREACAKVCDEWYEKRGLYGVDFLAKAIRARGEK